MFLDVYALKRVKILFGKRPSYCDFHIGVAIVLVKNSEFQHSYKVLACSTCYFNVSNQYFQTLNCTNAFDNCVYSCFINFYSDLQELHISLTLS